MKKFQLGLAVISLGLASSTVFAAADGTVTITGKVVDQTCNVGGASGSIPLLYLQFLHQLYLQMQQLVILNLPLI